MPTRDLNVLHPVVRERCLQLQAGCAEMGLKIGISQTARTPEEQTAFWAQGREPLKAVNMLRTRAKLLGITKEQNAKTITDVRTSTHQFELAFDIFLIDKGHAVWSAKADINADGDADYTQIGELGESLGLNWGGRFKGRDLVHFEWTGGLTLMELISGKRPEDLTINTQKKTGETP